MDLVIDQKVKGFFEKIPGVVTVFIFGSEAKGRRISSSDIDIAVLFSPKHIPDFRTRLDLKEDLVSLLQTEVDLVLLNLANPILKHQILKNGRQIFLQTRAYYNDFFARSVTEYADLKILRAPIEKSLLKGRSYGG